MYNKLLVFFFLFAFAKLSAQLKPEQWRSHLSYHFAYQLAASESEVFCLSDGELSIFSLEEDGLRILNKTDGLSDVGISAIDYNVENELLVIGYINGNIDLYYDSKRIYNIPAVYQASVAAGKCINHVFSVGNEAFLSTDFGLVVLDLEKREVKESYFLGDQGVNERILNALLWQNHLYVLVGEKIKHAPIDGVNLIDHQSWASISPALPELDRLIQISSFEHQFLILYQDISSNYRISYTHDFSSFGELLSSSEEINSISCLGDKLHVNRKNGIDRYNSLLEKTESIEDFPWGGINIKHSLIGADGSVWAADNGFGLIKFKQDGNVNVYLPNGPASNHSFKLLGKNNRLYNVGGSVNDVWTGVYNEGKLYIFEEEEWKNINNWNTNDYVSLDIDPTDKDHYFVGSWGFGLYEYKGLEIINHYDASNSVLNSVLPGSSYCRIGGLKFDTNGNLWISNSGVSNPISVFTKEGNWHTFNVGSTMNAPTSANIEIDENNTKWILLPRGYGLFAFNENDLPEDETAHDKQRISIRDNTGSLITNDVYSMTMDHKGDLWLGTNQGVLVYYYPENVFDRPENFYASRILIEYEDQLDYLLKYETVLDIAIDGANRKWIATQSSGVFLVSENGTEQLLHFTKDNSPLFSNKVNAIGILPESGEVFFATDYGLVSYQSDASEADNYYSTVYAYPNPVRPEYQGNIYIKGLKKNSSIKIVDLSGNLVFEGQSLGGKAVWDGKNLRGMRVKTGVYIAFIVDEEGRETATTKILFVN